MDKKEIGKIYNSKGTYILCSGFEMKKNTFGNDICIMQGVVVRQDDVMSDFRVGDYSTGWTGSFGVFNEAEEIVVLDNKNWKEYKEIGTCPG